MPSKQKGHQGGTDEATVYVQHTQNIRRQDAGALDGYISLCNVCPKQALMSVTLEEGVHVDDWSFDDF